MSQGPREEDAARARGYHVLKAVPVLQLVPQEASDGALVALGQGPRLQALISQGHAEEDPKICGPHPARTREHLLLHTAPAVCSEHAPPFTRGHVLTGRGGGTGPPGGHPSTGQPFPGAGAPGQQLRQARVTQPSPSHLGLAEPPDPRPGGGPQPPACSCPGSGHPPFQGTLCPSSRAKEFPRPAAAFSTQRLWNCGV